MSEERKDLPDEEEKRVEVLKAFLFWALVIGALYVAYLAVGVIAVNYQMNHFIQK